MDPTETKHDIPSMVIHDSTVFKHATAFSPSVLAKVRTLGANSFRTTGDNRSAPTVVPFEVNERCHSDEVNSSQNIEMSLAILGFDA